MQKLYKAVLMGVGLTVAGVLIHKYLKRRPTVQAQAGAPETQVDIVDLANEVLKDAMVASNDSSINHTQKIESIFSELLSITHAVSVEFDSKWVSDIKKETLGLGRIAKIDALEDGQFGYGHTPNGGFYLIYQESKNRNWILHGRPKTWLADGGSLDSSQVINDMIWDILAPQSNPDYTDQWLTREQIFNFANKVYMTIEEDPTTGTFD